MVKKVSEQQQKIAKRRKARHYAVQALYQWKMSQSSLNKIEAEFRTDNDFNKVDSDYFHELIHEVPAQLGEIDQAIVPTLTDRSFNEIGPVETALLRMSVYELKNRLDIPYKVVINEGVSLAKKFGATDSHKFINAVLDKVAESYRSVELKAAGR